MNPRESPCIYNESACRIERFRGIGLDPTAAGWRLFLGEWEVPRQVYGLVRQSGMRHHDNEIGRIRIAIAALSP